MAVKFNVSETRMNVTIELTDITDEMYRDLVAFISMRTDEKPKTEFTAADSKPVVPMPANDIPKVAKKVEGSRKYHGRHPDAAKAMDEYFAKAESNPKNYEKVIMSSHDFVELFPEYSEYPMRSIGRKLSEHCAYAGSIVGKTPNGSPAMLKRWHVPVPKKNPLGEAIKKGREESGLSVKELAELIEYPENVVKKWESGEYTPSCDGLSAMKLVLGEKLFEDLK